MPNLRQISFSNVRIAKRTGYVGGIRLQMRKMPVLITGRLVRFSVPRSRTRWECDVKASGNDRVIWRVPLHRKSNIIEWVLRLDDFLKQTGSKAILSPRRASGRLVLGWLWSSEGKGQDGFDVHQVWPFVTVSSTGPNRLEFVLVFRESVPRGLYA